MIASLKKLYKTARDDIFTEAVARYIIYVMILACIALAIVGILVSISNPWKLEYSVYFAFPLCAAIIGLILFCGYMAHRCYPDPPPAPDLKVTQAPKVLVYEEPFSTENPIHASPRQRSESREKSEKSLKHEKSEKSPTKSPTKSPKSSRRNSVDSIAIDVKEDSTFSVENPSLTTASSR